MQTHNPKQPAMFAHKTGNKYMTLGHAKHS